jgi:SAM-dependent methyltransferase
VTSWRSWRTWQDDGMQERAKLFGREAERYDRTRPGYPDGLIDLVLGPSPRELTVLDVASGTGIASRQLAERGAEVLGVELNPGMAEVAERRGVRTEVAAFEAWDPAGRAFDRVTCAQAWHWLEPEVSSTKVASVLRPGGRVCLFWSMGGYPDDLADELEATYRRTLPSDAPPLVIGYAANRSSKPAADLSAVADQLRRNGRFEEPEFESFPWTRTYTRDEWLDELQSHSDHAALPPDLRQQLLDEVGKTLDAFGGSFDMPYASALISATRD